MKIIIINGPNLNMLGRREPDIYGNQSFEKYFQKLTGIFPDLSLDYFQSNHEGELIDCIQRAEVEYDGIILNAAAYSHTSLAIADSLACISKPIIEVHISNIFARETFRHHSVISLHCKGVIVGLGLDGYRLAVSAIATM